MTAFYVLSGFALFYTWQFRNLQDVSIIKKFYQKRLIGIIPLYYVVAILYIILMGKETIFQNLLLAPVELLGIQSIFNSLFDISHNGGTWFISCLLVCYILYPFIQEITKQLRVKAKIIIIFFLIGILLYSPFIVYWFKTSTIYSNPFFRLLEFIIGVLICSLLPNISFNRIGKLLYSWQMVFLEYIMLIVGVSLGVKFNISLGNYMLYSWVALPMFVLLIISMFGVKFPYYIRNSKALIYFSKVSYAFFLGQFFAWKSTIYIVDIIGFDTNSTRIIISFLLCIIYAMILHELVEKFFIKVLYEKIYN